MDEVRVGVGLPFCFFFFASERKLRVEWEPGTEPVQNEGGRKEHEQGEFVPLAGKSLLWRRQKGERRVELDGWGLPSLAMS